MPEAHPFSTPPPELLPRLLSSSGGRNSRLSQRTDTVLPHTQSQCLLETKPKADLMAEERPPSLDFEILQHLLPSLPQAELQPEPGCGREPSAGSQQSFALWDKAAVMGMPSPLGGQVISGQTEHRPRGQLADALSLPGHVSLPPPIPLPCLADQTEIQKVLVSRLQ